VFKLTPPWRWIEAAFDGIARLRTIRDLDAAIVPTFTFFLFWSTLCINIMQHAVHTDVSSEAGATP
jgi:hypothetical protein